MSLLMRILPVLLIGFIFFSSLAGGVTLVLRQLNLYPPQTISIAAGKPGSAYYDYASAYRDVLARDGITLEIIESRGSVENATLLGSEAEADIALIQGGIALSDSVRGIASVQVEPLWIFATEAVADDPNTWSTLAVAAGTSGSGTRAIAEQLTAITGAAALDGSQTQPLSSGEAADALLAGSLDVALFVAPISAKYIQPLIASRALHLVGLAHAETLALRIPGARIVRMPSGSLDYRRPLPSTDTEAIALVTRLVAHEDVHPALVNRLVHAVTEVHGGQPVIPADRQYPSVQDLGIEPDKNAAQLFAKGFSPLEALLPYWIVAQLTRVLLLLLPMVLLLLPLLRLLPAVYQALLKRRVYGHYERVHEIDASLVREGAGLEMATLVAWRDELDDIEQALIDANLPNAYRKQAYTFQHHLDFVRRRLDKVMASQTET